MARTIAIELNEALHKLKEQEQEIARLKRELRKYQLMVTRDNYRERFCVNTFKGERVITTSDVRYIVSENKCTYFVLHDGSSFDINMTLTAIAEVLNPRSFMRVNRKYIVPLVQVERFEQDINGKERLILKHGRRTPKIIISRDNKHNVHDWVNGTM
ncbi:MAG: LytTR family transcriptional regulator DNA-binding domain-containing protein [Prevotella sp.]|nr:LytTR family transcriptional regulator DNA-binding domain-containing protein [Prevotella sp.]